MLQDVLKQIPQQPQVQYGTVDQLRDLIAFANRLGRYDAADYLRNVVNNYDSKVAALQLPRTEGSLS